MAFETWLDYCRVLVCTCSCMSPDIEIVAKLDRAGSLGLCVLDI